MDEHFSALDMAANKDLGQVAIRHGGPLPANCESAAAQRGPCSLDARSAIALVRLTLLT
jgi:hypothetical protein